MQQCWNKPNLCEEVSIPTPMISPPAQKRLYPYQMPSCTCGVEIMSKTMATSITQRQGSVINLERMCSDHGKSVKCWSCFKGYIYQETGWSKNRLSMDTLLLSWTKVKCTTAIAAEAQPAHPVHGDQINGNHDNNLLTCIQIIGSVVWAESCQLGWSSNELTQNPHTNIYIYIYQAIHSKTLGSSWAISIHQQGRLSDLIPSISKAVYLT